MAYGNLKFALTLISICILKYNYYYFLKKKIKENKISTRSTS